MLSVKNDARNSTNLTLCWCRLPPRQKNRVSVTVSRLKNLFYRLSCRLKAVCDEMKWQQIYSSSSKKHRIFNRFLRSLFFTNLLWYSKILPSFVIYYYRDFRNLKLEECLGFCCRLQFFRRFICLMKPNIWQRVTSKSSENISFQHRLVTDESRSVSSNINRKGCSKCWITKNALSRLYKPKIMNFRRCIAETAKNNRTNLWAKTTVSVSSDYL